MKTFVSIWSMNLLAIDKDMDAVDDLVDGYHVDVTDGHFVNTLLFGPDVVSAIRQRTKKTIEVHLMVSDVNNWVNQFAKAGADIITFHTSSTSNGPETIDLIQNCGAKATHAITVSETLHDIPKWKDISRYLLMGTEIGIKGVDIDGEIFDKIIGLKKNLSDEIEVWVDGGIRRHTVERLADAGADGVIPGSIVFADSNPCAMIKWLNGLGRSGSKPIGCSQI